MGGEVVVCHLARLTWVGVEVKVKTLTRVSSTTTIRSLLSLTLLT